MSRTTTKLLLLVMTLAGMGCGTVGNLTGRDHIYGGVVLDGTAVGTACKDVIGSEDAPHLGASRVAVMLVCGCVDLPLSVVADTVTLPITIPVSCYHWIKPPEKPPEATPAVPVVAVTTAPTAPITEPVGESKPASE